MQITVMEIGVIVFAFLIMFALLRLFKGDSMADRKRQEIEAKRQALIAKRKAVAEAEARAANQNSTRN